MRRPDQEHLRNFDRDAHILDLTKIRREIGDHWEEVRPSVHRLAARVIAYEMESRGKFIQHDDVYLLKFDNLSKKHARRECEMIGDKLMDLIFSGNSLEDRPQAKSRPGGRRNSRTRPARWRWFGFRSGIPTILSSLRAKLRKGNDRAAVANAGPNSDAVSTDRVIEAADEPLPMPSKASNKTGDGSIRQGQNRSSPAGRGYPRTAPQSGQASLASVPENAASSAGPSNALKQREKGSAAVENRPLGIPDDLSSADHARLSREALRIEKAMVSATIRQQQNTTEERGRSVFPPPNLHFVYRPMWNTRSKFLTTYRCIPTYDVEGSVVTGDAVLPNNDRQQNALTLDVLAVKDVIAEINALMERDITPILMAPVHLSTLVDHSRRMAFLDTIDSISGDANQRILFEIVDMEESAGQARALEVLGHLRRFSRGIIGRIPLRDENFAFWKLIELTAIGADLSQDERPEQAVIDDMEAFATMANHHKIECYIGGLRSVSLALAAVAAGFDYVEGSAIKTDEEKQEFDIAPFDVSDLYN